MIADLRAPRKIRPRELPPDEPFLRPVFCGRSRFSLMAPGFAADPQVYGVVSRFPEKTEVFLRPTRVAVQLANTASARLAGSGESRRDPGAS
jgi:hypothetical protein